MTTHTPPANIRATTALASLALSLALTTATVGGACKPASVEGGLGAFAGGFDPTRYDGGPLPALVAAPAPVRFSVPPFYATKLRPEEALVDGGALIVGNRSRSALEAYLETAVGVDIDILSDASQSYAEMTEAVASGAVDIAELSPYEYALVKDRVDALVATVAHGASTYGSYLVVKQGSAIRSVDDLKKKKIAFVDPLSTSGYLLPATFLRAHGFDLDVDVTVAFAGSHPAAIDAVQSGKVDAAAVSSDLLIGHSGLAGPLVVVAKAGRMPYDVIVAKKGLDPSLRAHVTNALLRLSIHDEKGREALRAFSSVDGFMPIPAGHYDEIVKLAREHARERERAGKKTGSAPTP